MTQQLTFPGYGVSLSERIDRAIDLLRQHEPPDGYYVAFSGGKDSQTILELCRMAGVKHDAHYNVTTIDPPELVRFIKRNYPDVGWNRPEHSMMWMVSKCVPKTPPTRIHRWCCEIYKERGGNGRTKVIGVRAAESPRRRLQWKEMTKHRNGVDDVICPIVHWPTSTVWDFLDSRGLPHCSIYDEGFGRIGCVGCPLAGPLMQQRQFARWPRFAANWKKAVIENWRRHQPPTMRRDGKPYYHASFATGEDFWQWWISGERREDPNREGCMSGLLYTNDDAVEEDSGAPPGA